MGRVSGPAPRPSHNLAVAQKGFAHGYNSPCLFQPCLTLGKPALFLSSNSWPLTSALILGSYSWLPIPALTTRHNCPSPDLWQRVKLCKLLLCVSLSLYVSWRLQHWSILHWGTVMINSHCCKTLHDPWLEGAMMYYWQCFRLERSTLPHNAAGHWDNCAQEEWRICSHHLQGISLHSAMREGISLKWHIDNSYYQLVIKWPSPF